MHNTRALELAHLNGMQPSLKRCWPPLTPHPCFRSSGSASGESLFKVLSLYVNTEQTETYIQLNSGTLKRYKRFRFMSVDCGRKLQHLERHADTGRTCRIRFMSQIICEMLHKLPPCTINAIVHDANEICERTEKIKFPRWTLFCGGVRHLTPHRLVFLFPRSCSVRRRLTHSQCLISLLIRRGKT